MLKKYSSLDCEEQTLQALKARRQASWEEYLASQEEAFRRAPVSDKIFGYLIITLLSLSILVPFWLIVIRLFHL